MEIGAFVRVVRVEPIVDPVPSREPELSSDEADSAPEPQPVGAVVEDAPT